MGASEGVCQTQFALRLKVCDNRGLPLKESGVPKRTLFP